MWNSEGQWNAIRLKRSVTVETRPVPESIKQFNSSLPDIFARKNKLYIRPSKYYYNISHFNGNRKEKEKAHVLKAHNLAH